MEMDKRKELHKVIFKSVGTDVVIKAPFHWAYDENVSIGVHIFLNYDYVLLDDCPITIGSEVLIGPGCKIITSTHSLDYRFWRNRGAVISKIENDFFIVAGVTILPCATGSDKVVVGVGSVVTQDIPPETIVAGILAKPIRKLEFD